MRSCAFCWNRALESELTKLARPRRRKRKKQAHRFGCVLALLLAITVVAGAFLYKPVKRAVEERLWPVEYEAIVERWAGEYGVDPYLVYAVIRTESSFREDAVSSAGAIGLMQMTEETFDWIKTKLTDVDGLEFESLYEAEHSIRFGTRFIALSLERYGGDVATAAAAYHSGWGTVDGLLAEDGYSDNGVMLRVFPYNQMQHYVNKVTEAYESYLELYTERT